MTYQLSYVETGKCSWQVPIFSWQRWHISEWKLYWYLSVKERGKADLWTFEVLVQFSWVTQLCLTLCDPMDCSKLGFSVHHHPPELAQTHVHRVSDAIQPSHSLSPLLFLPSIFSSIESFPVSQFFTSSSQSIRVSASNEYSGLIPFRIDWFDLIVQGILKSLLQHHSSKASIFEGLREK